MFIAGNSGQNFSQLTIDDGASAEEWLLGLCSLVNDVSFISFIGEKLYLGKILIAL